MHIFKGELKHIRIGNKFPYKWFTFKDGDLVSEDIIDEVTRQGGKVEKETPIVEKEIPVPDLKPKKKKAKKK